MSFTQFPSSCFRTTPIPTFSLPIRASSRLSLPTTHSLNPTGFRNWVPDFSAKSLNWVFSGAIALTLSVTGAGLAEAKVGVNKPELLPRNFTPVIDVAGFLSDGQEKRLAQEISDIEKDTGFKLRVLAQNYPDTPGNILNFNVGATVDLDIPRSFWSRLAGKYGNMFYWKEKGEDASIEAAVMAISNCLREPVGPSNCSEVK
ncbi:thylakoid lumenal 15.0 kDa protein 2, chloroplastic-like isoform X3 [Hibiscus syriacus]|uniref:thylakoid lumenal 15.0 kDa protein 2, chloroplastic-like isoform X3 n=1 Tax=Hibiscus syriacus TaxID=106335 RepID=UPI0019208891|nr:thylakoid lumenal 15.0 kDa protein 2, chloroplastic-like isoform X3 [Hibiscus syriacus]